MELTELCTKLKFEHLPAQLDTLCEQAAKRELNYPEFLNQTLMTERQARRLKGVERGLRLHGFPTSRRSSSSTSAFSRRSTAS
jgi:DNA replication protein DnaC